MTKIHLRHWQPGDAAALSGIADNLAIWNQVRDRFPHPYTLQEAMKWIEMVRNQDPVLNFAVISDQAIAGCISCIPQSDVHSKSMEVGYFVGEGFWGKGIASEALRQLLNYIKEHFEVVRIFACVQQGNRASMRVLQKNDFYLECIHRKAVFKKNSILDEYIWVRMMPSTVSPR